MIRLVDRESVGWGHINFDDFRLHDTKPARAAAAAGRRPLDVYAHAGLDPEEAARAMTVPPGFQVTLFAGEPDVVQPIAMAIDDRGRLWVAEAYSYPGRVPETEARDRILIFEDTDGDGQFDTRKVFADQLNLVSGLEVGFGGVWVGAAPHFLFIPDRDGDDRPDGPPEVLLDGWGQQDTHETLNTLHLGPRWLALRLPRRVHALARRQARHAQCRAHPDQRRHLAISPDPTRLRGLRPRHQQPLGHRLRRARPDVHHRLRHPAPVPRDPGRAVRAAGEASTSTPIPTTTSRRSPTTGTTSAPTRTAATADPTRPAAATPMPAR